VWISIRSSPLTDTDDPILVRCVGVSPDFFDALGIDCARAVATASMAIRSASA
jgi:hypothetical protein